MGLWQPNRPFIKPRILKRSSQSDGMIIFVTVKLKQILKKGRRYRWPKPELCPRCGISKLWGHGYVLAYFDGLPAGVLLRRYRCPGCHCVIRLRPKGYFGRFQASIETVRASIWNRVENGRYLPGISWSRQRHWLVALLRNAVAYLGNSWKNRLSEAFDRLMHIGKVPVSGSI